MQKQLWVGEKSKKVSEDGAPIYDDTINALMSRDTARIMITELTNQLANTKVQYISLKLPGKLHEDPGARTPRKKIEDK